MSYFAKVRILDSQGRVIDPATKPDREPASEETLQELGLTIEDLLKRLKFSISLDGSTIASLPITGQVSIVGSVATTTTSPTQTQLIAPAVDDGGRVRTVMESSQNVEAALADISMRMLTEDEWKMRTLGPARTAVVRNVTVGSVSTTLAAANINRKALSIGNDSATSLFVKCGFNVSSSDYTVLIPTNSYFELPQPIYVGQVDAVALSGTIAVHVTEYS